MDDKELELIKKMVIHGIYKICLIHGYGKTIFNELKQEQNRVFENYVINKKTYEEREKMFNEEYGL